MDRVPAVPIHESIIPERGRMSTPHLAPRNFSSPALGGTNGSLSKKSNFWVQ